jgi:hypothetical protein
MSEKEKAKLDGLNGKIVDLNKKYMKLLDGEAIEVTKEEYDIGLKKQKDKIEKGKKQKNKNQVTIASICDTSTTDCPDSESTPNWITLTTIVSQIASTSPQEYLIKHEFDWTPFFPDDYLKDAIGVSLPDQVTPIQDSEYLKVSKDEYDFWGAYQGTNDQYYWSANDKTGGMAFTFDMASIGYMDANYEGHMAFRVVRANPNYTSAWAAGHYSHSTKGVQTTYNVSVNDLGMSVTGVDEKVDAIQTGVSFNF